MAAPRFAREDRVYYRGDPYVYACREGIQFCRIERVKPDSKPGDLAVESFCVPEAILQTPQEYADTLEAEEREELMRKTETGAKARKTVEDIFPDVDSCVAYFQASEIPVTEEMKAKFAAYMTAPNPGVKKMHMLNMYRHQMKLKGEGQL